MMRTTTTTATSVMMMSIKNEKRDDVDGEFDDFVANGSAKEVEDEINDAMLWVHTVVTINDNASTLSTLTVPKLKERLREAGLPVSGKKSELIACPPRQCII